MIADFLEFLANGVFDFLNGFFGLFPQMPVTGDEVEQMGSITLVQDVVGWVNYFLPIDIAAGILALWATAMMAYVGFKLAIKYSEKIVT